MYRRLGTVSLLALTAAVAVGLVYVLVHSDAVPQAGQTPGYTASSSTAASTTPAATSAASAPASTPESSTASTTGPATTVHRVTVLGDDWVAGVGASSGTTPWTHQVGSRLGVTVSAVSSSGAGYAHPGTNGGTYASLVDAVVRSTPDAVVVFGGRNDAGDDTATLRAATTALFAQLHRRLPHATLVAIAPFWGDSPHPATLTPVDSAVRAGVQAAGGTYLDVADPLTGHAGWMADAADPDDRGYRAIADAVTAALRPLLGG